MQKHTAIPLKVFKMQRHPLKGIPLNLYGDFAEHVRYVEVACLVQNKEDPCYVDCHI